MITTAKVNYTAHLDYLMDNNYYWLAEGLPIKYKELFCIYTDRLRVKYLLPNEIDIDPTREKELSFKVTVIRRLFDNLVERKYEPYVTNYPYKWTEKDNHIIERIEVGDELDTDKDFCTKIADYCAVYISKYILPLYEILNFDIIKEDGLIHATNFRSRLAKNNNKI